MDNIYAKCKEIVRQLYADYDASHDFFHIERVERNAEQIMKKMNGVQPHIVRLAVLLHDVEDTKYALHKAGTVERILQELEVCERDIQFVSEVIDSVSFSGGNPKPIQSLEAAIVRDADRLDAIGAIGIARAFAFGGARDRLLYDSEELPRTAMSEEQYRSKQTATVTHFYEKLLKLKELMVTDAGKQLAEQRHAFMEQFLGELEREVGPTIQRRG